MNIVHLRAQLYVRVIVRAGLVFRTEHQFFD